MRLKFWFKEVFDEAQTNVREVLQHVWVNFLYGLFSGLVITAVSIGFDYLIVFAYYGLKQVEGKILNRNKYTSRLGKNIIFPFPSLIGFILGYKISLFFK